MTLKRAEVTSEERDFPVQVRKRRVVSGRSHPLVVENRKSAFADFEILHRKSCACDAVERGSQLNDIGSGRTGSDYVAAKKLLKGVFYLNVVS